MGESLRLGTIFSEIDSGCCIPSPKRPVLAQPLLVKQGLEQGSIAVCEGEGEMFPGKYKVLPVAGHTVEIGKEMTI